MMLAWSISQSPISMPVAATMSTFLPATNNPLGSSQCARLLTSMRQPVGASPHVLEAGSLGLNPRTTISTTQHENPKGQQLYLSPSATSSIASFVDSLESYESLSTGQKLSQNRTKKTGGGWKSTHLRTLVLRLRKIPSIPFLSDRAKQLSPLSSSSSVESALNSAKIPALHPPVNTEELPPSPLFPPEYDPAWSTTKASQGKIHLKRVAKLIRTLGKNIKPEFAFCQKHLPVSQDPKSKNEPSLRSRSRSLRPIWPRDAVSSAEPASTSAHDSLQACVQQSNVPPESSDPQANVVRKRWHRSASIGSLLTRAAANANKSTVAQKPPSAHGLSRSTTTLHSQDTSCGNQANWDGEWSIKDSHERAMVLRNLKCG